MFAKCIVNHLANGQQRRAIATSLFQSGETRERNARRPARLLARSLAADAATRRLSHAAGGEGTMASAIRTPVDIAIEESGAIHVIAACIPGIGRNRIWNNPIRGQPGVGYL